MFDFWIYVELGDERFLWDNNVVRAVKKEKDLKQKQD